MFEGDGQFDLAAATDTDIYTCPIGFQCTVRVFMCNRTGAAIQIRIAVSRAGAGLVGSQYLYYDYDLAGGEPLDLSDLSLNEVDIIRVRASAIGVSANVFIQSANTLQST